MLMDLSIFITPGTHSTPNEIGLQLGISRSSVRRKIIDDLKFRPLKKIKGQKLTDIDCSKRRELAKQLLEVYSEDTMNNAFFSDEKLFKVQQLYNSKNDVLYAPADQPKSSVSEERIYCERQGFPKKIMVSVSVSKRGRTPIHFVDLGSSVTGEYYRIRVLKKMIPQMNRIAGYKPYLFMQDGARSHTAKDTVEMLNSQNYLILLQPQMWPPNSFDLNPVDFFLWAELERRVYKGRKITSIESLKQAIEEEWEQFPQELINKAIDAFPLRLKRCVEAKGRHIETY